MTERERVLRDFRDVYAAEFAARRAQGIPVDAAHEVAIFAVYLHGKAAALNALAATPQWPNARCMECGGDGRNIPFDANCCRENQHTTLAAAPPEEPPTSGDGWKPGDGPRKSGADHRAALQQAIDNIRPLIEREDVEDEEWIEAFGKEVPLLVMAAVDYLHRGAPEARSLAPDNVKLNRTLGAPEDVQGPWLTVEQAVEAVERVIRKAQEDYDYPEPGEVRDALNRVAKGGTT